MSVAGIFIFDKAFYNRGMQIVFFETMPGEEEFFRSRGTLPPNCELIFFPEPLTNETASRAHDAVMLSVFVKSSVTREVIDQLPNLKLITTRSTGYDHIDWEYAKSKGIPTANVASYGAHTVAEFAFGLLLMVSRKLYPACHQLREGLDFTQSTLQGFDLNGKILGVVGTGRIGRNVIGIAQGFGLKVLAYDTHPDSAFARSVDITYASLPDLLARSDIVTLHVPYMKETHHLIGTEQFSRMKKGAYLINTARGEIVDTEALVEALRTGVLAGAGLDVLEGERELRDEFELLHHATHPVDFRTLAANHLLIDLPNVIVTPHIAFNTREAMHEIMATTAQTIRNFVTGTSQKYL